MTKPAGPFPSRWASGSSKPCGPSRRPGAAGNGRASRFGGFGSGDVTLVPNASNNEAILLNRLMNKGASLAYAAEAFVAGGRAFPAGTVAVRSAGPGRSALVDALKGLGVEARAASPGSAVTFRPLLKPRIASTSPGRPAWTRLAALDARAARVRFQGRP